MIFGGALGLVLLGLGLCLFIAWLAIRFLLIYLKWSHQLDIKIGSVGLGDIENIAVHHRLFQLHIGRIGLLSPLSFLTWQLPTLSISHVDLKMHSTNEKKNNQKREFKTKLALLKYVSINIDKFHMEMPKINIVAQRISLRSAAAPSNANSDMWINFEHIEVSMFDTDKQLLMKSTWNTMEIQSNFDQRWIINMTHWSLELDHKIFAYLREKPVTSVPQLRPSKFRYMDPNLVPTVSSFRSHSQLDKWLDILHDPLVDLTLRHFSLQFTSTDGQQHRHTLDAMHCAFHNSTNACAETRHAYILHFRLHSHSTFLVTGQCQAVISPVRLNVECQLHEFNLQLHEDTIRQFHALLPSLSSSSSSSSTSPWKSDRTVDLSFQLIDTRMSLKMNEIDEWLVGQMHQMAGKFRHQPNSETNWTSDIQEMILYTSDENKMQTNKFSRSLFDDLSRRHFWNCLFYLPNANMKITNTSNLAIQIEFDVNGLRLQSNFILTSIVQRLRMLWPISRPTKSVSNRSIHISAQFHQITLVLCDTVPVYLSTSISSLRLNRTHLDMKKLTTFFADRPRPFSATSIPLTSLSSHGQKILDIRRIQFHHPTSSLIKISLPNELKFVWSTKFHLFLYRYISTLKLNSQSNGQVSVGNNIQIEIEPCAHVYLQLAIDCSIHLEFHHFSLRWIRQQQLINSTNEDEGIQIDAHCSQMIVDWQQQCEFIIHNISLTRLERSNALTTERILLQKTIGTLDMLNNRASLVQIDWFSIRFPFDSAFNEVTEKLVNIKKWLTRLHRTGGDMSQSFLQQIPRHTISDQVWTDLSIKILDFELTIVDDQFETTLFQNYCLMADEYHERELREQELQRRIDEHDRLGQPLNNILDLKRALTEVNARVYIKRNQQTNFDENANRIKRNLIRWHLHRVDLTALADRQWTGKENVLEIIKRIDADSPSLSSATTDLCTLWCRYVLLKCDEWSVHFRDFRQPFWKMLQFHLWGYICGAETTPDNLGSIRNPWVEIGEPYSPSRVQVQRLLSPLKFYHDINSDIQSFIFSYGPAWENTMAQVNLCLNGITPRTADPSPLLSWWDKIRLYLHGRWSFAAGNMSWLYHVASSPYNDTEEMEWFWNQAYVDWTNGKFIFRAASLSIKLRTSSKYDDCCLLFLPNVDTRITLNWLCIGNPNDHHAVRLCTRDAVKSSSEAHDSYAQYRSHHLIATAKFECKEVPEQGDPPTCTIYASTLRFCEQVKNTMMSITRPTRRGALFVPRGETVVPLRKPLLSRHYEAAELQLILPQFRVIYLTSYARKTGAQVDCQLFNFVTYQELHLIDCQDGLARRARTSWTPKMMNVNLKRAQMWLLRDVNEDKDTTEVTAELVDREQSQRTFFLSLDSLIYIRSASATPATTINSSTHSILIDELKAVWNIINRRTLFLVYERYRRNNMLRSNLSNPFAKEIEHLQQQTSETNKNDGTIVPEKSPSSASLNQMTMMTDDQSTTMNFNASQPSTLASFLDQLITEREQKPSADLGPTVETSVPLIGLRQCTKDDVVEHTLRIELVDSQIALRGIESSGYVILSAAVALVDQYRHEPVWRDQQLCDKTSWQGDLQAMQYFATTASNGTTASSSSDDIIWIPRRDIRDENSLLGESSRSVVGSVASTTGSGDEQLQCIISKSNAALTYVFYTEQAQQEEETETNIVIPPFIKSPMNESHSIVESDRLPVDSFTFIHNDIQLSTNSLQYRTIMDIVNNLLLYVEPKQEGTNNRLKKLRLQIQLANNLPVLRESIRHLLERVRSTLAELRRLERELYYFDRDPNNLIISYSSEEEDGIRPYSSNEKEQLQTLYSSIKAQLGTLAAKLGMMCAVYKDMQIARLVKLRIAATSNKTARLNRRYELHGGSITWFIKHDDGQITNAQFLLRNILYTKRNYENDTNEHSVIIEQAQVDNLLPDDRYRTILAPNYHQQQAMIRVYCKEGESVGGIAVKEHLEINVSPLVIQMTRRFSQMLMAFLFPGKAQPQHEEHQNQRRRPPKSSFKQTTSGSFKRRTRSAEGDDELLAGRSLFYFSVRDLDAMEKRAENTLTFRYIKIPEVSLNVSYKIRGTKEKKIGDLENARISFPTLEYRDLTCSWHDLVLAIKSDVKTMLVSQAIRQNLNLRLPFMGKSTRAQNQLIGTPTMRSQISLNSNSISNNIELTTTNEKDDEEEQQHKMKLVLGTKVSQDLINQFRRRKGQS